MIVGEMKNILLRARGLPSCWSNDSKRKAGHVMQLVAIALAPIFALFTYFYIRDQYEKEPGLLLLLVFGGGFLSVVPVVFFGHILYSVLNFVLDPRWILYDIIENFIVIALVEEGFKFLVVMLLAYRHPAFNEPYDGMLYAITASLGFAAFENILYVLNGGLVVGFARMVLSVPAHALFGAFMGYYAGRAKFSVGHGKRYLLAALLFPTFLHGLYNFLLSINRGEFALLVVPLSLFMWWRALRQVRTASLRSPFRPQNLPPWDEA